MVEEEEPDDSAIGILFTLSLMSFTYSAPRRYSENLFVPDEDWNFSYFIEGLRFRCGSICFTSDYVSGRLMKTDSEFVLLLILVIVLSRVIYPTDLYVGCLGSYNTVNLRAAAGLVDIFSAGRAGFWRSRVC